jgi:ribosomal protein S18 acetylase RimI-like enzyme
VHRVSGTAFAVTALLTGVTKQLSRPSEGDATYRRVLALAKVARRTVGFLTDSAFAQRARQGTLIAASRGDEVAGYILYDLPRDEIRIVHLVVAAEYQCQGIARELVDAVADDHAERRGILLHCRNDFPADDLWHKLDFVPVGERPGRSFEGKLLTRWFRSFGQPDLFTLLHEEDSRPVATMDACAFIDLIAPRPKSVAEQLRADWLGEHVRLAVTDHLLVEIHKGPDPKEHRRQTAAADEFRLSSTGRTTWKSVYSKLLDAHPDAPPKDHDDLTHIAQSIAAQATWLITNDRPFVHRYGATAAELGGLRLVSPPAFLREVDEQARGDRYRPIDLAGTAVTRRQVNASALSGLAAVFVNHQASERIRDLRATIELAAASPSTVRLEVIEVDDNPRGLVCWQFSERALDVLLVRATAGRGETTIGRHLLGLIRDQAVASDYETIRIVDPHPSRSVQRSFRDEGFAATPDSGLIAHALAGNGTFSQLRERAAAIGSPLAGSELLAGQSDDLTVRAAAAERWFAPFRVLQAGIPSFVVPIQHGWATALLDAGLAQEQLLPREWGLGLRRELVYYRSPRNAGRLTAPARLLWYVSGSAPGAGMIRAVSHLTEVAVDEYERLFHRFKPLGVYTRKDVAARADARGNAMALRFSHTECFEHPIPLDAYREIVSGDPKSRQVVLRSARPIDEHTFVSLLQLGKTGHRA